MVGKLSDGHWRIGDAPGENYDIFFIQNDAVWIKMINKLAID